jgi:polyhydroxyalkanoate synthesis regulator phasin
MAKRSFDYKHTCPDIDLQIRYFKENLSDNLIDLISELNPMFAGTDKEKEYRDSWVNIIYDSAENCFEGVRKTNEDMRKEAEYQIENLIEELEEARRLASHWESEAEEKDRKIDELEEELFDLRETITG